MAGVITAVFVVAAVALFGATLWRPAIGLVTLAIAVPLTTGMGRGTVIPLLRPNEALLLVVTVALGLQYLLRPAITTRTPLPLRSAAGAIGGSTIVTFAPRTTARATRRWAAIDLAVVAFTAGGAVIPFLTLWLSRTPIDGRTWQAIGSPLQFLLIYGVFRCVPLSKRDIRLCLNLAMAASVVVAGLAVAQLLQVGPIASFLATYFPTPPAPAWDPIRRPDSTLGLYSSVGAFCMLNYALALVLAAVRSREFHPAWLGFVMAADVMGVLASQTWAPAVGLVLATIVVLVYTRRVPWQLSIGIVAVSLALVLFGTQVTNRIAAQGVQVGGNLLLPETMRYRLTLWQDYYLPALSESPWVGTGTVVPTVVPERLDVSVDNEYLRVAYRDGVIGLLLLGILLVTVGATGWRVRGDPDPLMRALGGAALAYVVAAAVMGITEEYLAYGGVGQQVAIVVGIFAGLYMRSKVLPVPEAEEPVARVRVLKVGFS